MYLEKLKWPLFKNQLSVPKCQKNQRRSKRTNLADEVSGPCGRPIREFAPSLTQVNWFLQFRPVNFLLTALVPEGREGGKKRWKRTKRTSCFSWLMQKNVNILQVSISKLEHLLLRCGSSISWICSGNLLHRRRPGESFRASRHSKMDSSSYGASTQTSCRHKPKIEHRHTHEMSAACVCTCIA